MDYIYQIIFFVAVYSILAISLDLLAGQTGIVSVAHAAFYGLGAYTAAILAIQFSNSFILCTLSGMIVAVLISFIISLPSLRLRGDYFLIATFGFQMILLSIFNNWKGLTRGPLGIMGIPLPNIWGLSISSRLEFTLAACLLATITFIIVTRIARSPFGRVLRVLREDEIYAQALGKNPLKYKVTVFAVSGALAALAGSLYAFYSSFVDPTSFTVLESILVISMVIIGGAGSHFGPVIGAILLVVLPEIFRFLGFPDSIAANLRQVFYGTVLIVLMILRPYGLIGRYAFK